MFRHGRDVPDALVVLFVELHDFHRDHRRETGSSEIHLDGLNARALRVPRRFRDLMLDRHDVERQRNDRFVLRIIVDGGTIVCGGFCSTRTSDVIEASGGTTLEASTS